MSVVMEEENRRWKMRRKSALILEFVKGKTIITEESRTFDLTPSDIEGGPADGQRGGESFIKARPKDVREQYECLLKKLPEAYGEDRLELRAKIIGVRVGQG